MRIHALFFGCPVEKLRQDYQRLPPEYSVPQYSQETGVGQDRWERGSGIIPWLYRTDSLSFLSVHGNLGLVINGAGEQQLLRETINYFHPFLWQPPFH